MMQALKVGQWNVPMNELINILPLLTNFAKASLEKNSKSIAKIVLIDTNIEMYSELGPEVNSLFSSAFLKGDFVSADFKLVVFEFDLPKLYEVLTLQDSRGNLLLRDFKNEELYIAINRAWNAIYFLDKTASIGGVWVADCSKIPLISFITPLRALLSWCVEDKGYELVHAAGVGIGGKGIALTGTSGSGKSTLAIFAATRKCEILGDDAILINKKRIYAVYPNAKVDLSSPFFDLDSLGVHYLSDVRSRKAILDLREDSFKFSREFPLNAFVLPVIGSGVRFSEVPKTNVLREFLPQTMKELLGGTTRNARNLFDLVSSVPFFKLELGPEMDENLEALYRIAELT